MNFPQEITDLTAGTQCTQENIGLSGDSVYRFEKEGVAQSFLKVSSTPTRNAELTCEKDNLLWLQGKLAVPKVMQYLEQDQTCYLLSSALPGRDFSHWKELGYTETQTMETLATLLGQIHSLPYETCPHPRPIQPLIKQAEANTRAGIVDESDFDNDRLGRSAQSLLVELKNLATFEDDMVYCHGDFCLPNIMVDTNGSLAILDLGRAGSCDRYMDIALLLRSFEQNTNSQLLQVFLEHYPHVDELDLKKIEFYRLMDEFF